MDKRGKGAPTPHGASPVLSYVQVALKPITSASEVMFHWRVSVCLCLSVSVGVCLSVSNCSQKLLIGSSGKFYLNKEQEIKFLKSTACGFRSRNFL